MEIGITIAEMIIGIHQLLEKHILVLKLQFLIKLKKLQQQLNQLLNLQLKLVQLEKKLLKKKNKIMYQLY